MVGGASPFDVSREWMYERKDRRGGLSHVFVDGVDYFVDRSLRNSSTDKRDGKMKCPCTVCHNGKYLIDDDIKYHLVKNGFIAGYRRWVWVASALDDR